METKHTTQDLQYLSPDDTMQEVQAQQEPEIKIGSPGPPLDGDIHPDDAPYENHET